MPMSCSRLFTPSATLTWVNPTFAGPGKKRRKKTRQRIKGNHRSKDRGKSTREVSGKLLGKNSRAPKNKRSENRIPTTAKTKKKEFGEGGNYVVTVTKRERLSHCRPHRSPAARVCSSCEGGSILQRLRASGDDSYKRSASTPAQNKRGSYPLRTIYLSRLPATLVLVNNTQASYAHVTQQNEAPRKCTLESSSASRCRTIPPP